VIDPTTAAIVAASVAQAATRPELTLVEGGAGKGPEPIRVDRVLSAREHAHSLRHDSLPQWMRDNIDSEASAIDAAFGDRVFPKRADDGLGKRLSATDLRPGLKVYAPNGLKGHGRRSEADSVAPRSCGTVAKVSAEWVASVEFTDAESGEVKIVDCHSHELRGRDEDEGWAA